MAADFFPVAESVDYCARANHAQAGADAFGHHHQQSLGSRLVGGRSLPVDKQGACYVEEVEPYSVDEHGRHNEPEAAAGIAQREAKEVYDPGTHGGKDGFLNPRAGKDATDGKNPERFRDLRQG